MILPANLASMNLYQPLLVGKDPVEEGGDITWACWPSYVRQTLAVGGDHSATFSFSAADEILERWFDDYLACHFEESYGGVPTFQGLVWAMRLSYNGVVLSKSLDQLANSVRVTYKTGSAAAEATTSAVTNAASIARYGTKEHLEKYTATYIDATAAGYFAGNLLTKMKEVRGAMEEARLAGSDGQPGVLQVEVRGYVHTLNYRTRTSAFTTTDNANVAISAALSSADFVTAGAISVNAAQVSKECTDMPVWDRIRDIVAVGGNTQRWLAGCYQSRLLDYKQADETTIQYEQEMRSQRRLTFVPGSGEIVPAPLVQPGGVAFVRDLMAGRPIASPILEDPRALFVEMVEYSQAGAVLKGNPRSEANKAAALGLALRQADRKTTMPIIVPVKPIDDSGRGESWRGR